MKYKVEIKETLSRIVDVEVDHITPRDAGEKTSSNNYQRLFREYDRKKS